MEATVVGGYISVMGIIIIIDTLVVGTLVSAMARPVHQTITQFVPHLKIVIQSQVSLIIMCEDGIHLAIRVRSEISSVEGRVERVDVGGERRHCSVVRHQ